MLSIARGFCLRDDSIRKIKNPDYTVVVWLVDYSQVWSGGDDMWREVGFFWLVTFRQANKIFSETLSTEPMTAMSSKIMSYLGN